MTTTNIFIITQKDYPLRSIIEKSSIPYSFLEDGLPRVSKGKEKILVDATLLQDKKKVLLWKHFSHFPIPIYSDLSINFGAKLLARYPQVIAGMSLGVFSPKNCVELCWNPLSPFFQEEEEGKGKKHWEEILGKVLHSLHLEGKEVSSAGVCFHYPRVISMLINEAYYVWESGLAKEQNINQSMQWGANYPLGLLEWASQIGPFLVVRILKKLHQVYPTGRYTICPALLKEEK